MPTSPYFPSYYGGTSGEQGLVQDLVDEQIKLFGTDIYYLPRTIITDGVLDDIIYNKFESQFQIEMLLQNVEGFGSPSEFISKFGLRITDEVRFVVSQRRWEEAADGYTLTVPGRPNEGDLLYFPLTEDIYEIKFVEREDMNMAVMTSLQVLKRSMLLKVCLVVPLLSLFLLVEQGSLLMEKLSQVALLEQKQK